MRNVKCPTHATSVERTVNQQWHVGVPVKLLQSIGLDRGCSLWIEVVNQTTLSLSSQRPVTKRPHYPAEVTLGGVLYLVTDLRAQVKFTPSCRLRMTSKSMTITVRLIS